MEVRFFVLKSPMRPYSGKTPPEPLTDSQILRAIKEIVRKYLPKAKIYLYGSRAKGTHSRVSDYDIAIDNGEKIDVAILQKIIFELEDLPTLRTFDVIDLNNISKDFYEIIREDLKEI